MTAQSRITSLLLGFVASMQLLAFSTKVAFGTFNTTILAFLPVIILGFLLTICISKLLTGRAAFRPSKMDALVGLFFLFDLAQVFNPYLGALHDYTALDIGLRGFQQRSFFGLIYFAARMYGSSEKEFQGLMAVIAYTSAASSVYAIGSLLFDFNIEQAYRENVYEADPNARLLLARRGIGFLGSPFTFGVMSAFGLLCGLYLQANKGLSRFRRMAVPISIFVNSAGVLLSGSRSTYLGIAIAIITQLLLLPWKLKLAFVWNTRRVALACLLAIAALFLSFPDSDVVNYATERVESLKLLNIFSKRIDTLSEENFAVRFELASYTLPFILDRPLGYGTGIFTGGANPHGLITVGGFATWVDNEFSALALEMGIPGLIIFLIIVCALLYECRIITKVQSLQKRASLLTVLVVLCPASGLGGQWLTAFPVNCMFWIFAGIAVSLHNTVALRWRDGNLQMQTVNPAVSAQKAEVRHQAMYSRPH